VRRASGAGTRAVAAVAVSPPDTHPGGAASGGRMLVSPRVPLFGRLPEIYRIRDAEQFPSGQLQAYLGAIEAAFGAVHEDIEALYQDFFIETCADWLIPYIADLLGTSHLHGDPHTLRADVADTIALRRRKGTRAAIERLAAN